MRRTRTVEVNCPECEAPLKVEVSPPWPVEIEDVTGAHAEGCPLIGRECDSASFCNLVLAAFDDEDKAARDQEDDSRMERERDRAWEDLNLDGREP